jgi:hypothetical protein
MLMDNDSTYLNNLYDISYLIGQTYHSIGDLHNLDSDFRIKSYYMSMAYLRFSLENTKRPFYLYYYNGMVEHKLGISLSSSDRYLFLQDANDFYCNSLNFSPSLKSKIYLYSYIADVNNDFMLYIANNGDQHGMQTYEEYKQARDLALETAEQLRSIGM